MKIIIYTMCGLMIIWSFFAMWKYAPPDLTMNLGLTEQQEIYSFEPVIYLDNNPLPACSEDIETRVCRYSCDPDGVCVFIPRELIKKYKF